MEIGAEQVDARRVADQEYCRHRRSDAVYDQRKMQTWSDVVEKAINVQQLTITKRHWSMSVSTQRRT